MELFFRLPICFWSIPSSKGILSQCVQVFVLHWDHVRLLLGQREHDEISDIGAGEQRDPSADVHSPQHPQPGPAGCAWVERSRPGHSAELCCPVFAGSAVPAHRARADKPTYPIVDDACLHGTFHAGHAASPRLHADPLASVCSSPTASED